MPPGEYWFALLAFGVAAIVVRMVRRRPLIPRLALNVGRTNVALAVIALSALGFHCAAMFFPDAIASLPATKSAASAITELGLASQLAYAIPGAIIVLSLRRVWLPAALALAAALTTVGITMYWWLGLWTHLAAIALAMVLLVFVFVGLLESVGGSRRRPSLAPGVN